MPRTAVESPWKGLNEVKGQKELSKSDGLMHRSPPLPRLILIFNEIDNFVSRPPSPNIISDALILYYFSAWLT